MRDMRDKQINFLTPKWDKNRILHRKKVYFTRVIVTLALLRHQISRSKIKLFLSSCIIYYFIMRRWFSCRGVCFEVLKKCWSSFLDICIFYTLFNMIVCVLIVVEKNDARKGWGIQYVESFIEQALIFKRQWPVPKRITQDKTGQDGTERIRIRGLRTKRFSLAI